MPVDKSGANVREMFADIAPRYDLMNHLLSMNVDRYWRRRTVRLAPAEQTGAPMLDLCTGTGDLALAYHRATRGAVPIVAADFCRPMLEIGEQKKQKRGAGEVTFVEADAEHLPFPEDHFQLVTVAFGLRNVSDTRRGLSEMARVLRPGGKVAVLEFSHPRWKPVKSMYLFYFRNVLPRIGQLFARNRRQAYNYLPESVGEFPCYEELTEMMRQCGFAEARFHPLTLGIATLYVGVK